MERLGQGVMLMPRRRDPTLRGRLDFDEDGIQVAAAFAVIDQVMASNRRDADRLRGSVVIDAAPGLGKTTIAPTGLGVTPSGIGTRISRSRSCERVARSALAPRCWPLSRSGA